MGIFQSGGCFQRKGLPLFQFRNNQSVPNQVTCGEGPGQPMDSTACDKGVTYWMAPELEPLPFVCIPQCLLPTTCEALVKSKNTLGRYPNYAHVII